MRTSTISSLLLLALSLASCSEDTVGGSTAFVSTPLAFSATAEWCPLAIGTRAANDNNKTFVNGDAINVTAYCNSKYSFLMQDQKVTYDGSAWSYSPVRYWPQSGSITFYAHYPYSTDDGNISSSFVGTSTVPTLTFTQPASADIDLLVTETSTIDCATRESDKVSFKMKHALAKVNFLFNNSSSSAITVQKLSFTVNNGKGTFQHKYTTDGLPSWSITATSSAVTVTKDLGAEQTIAAGSSTQVDGFTSYVLPCTVSSFVLGDKTYTPSEEVQLVAGMEYNITFNANGTTTITLDKDDANCYMVAPPSTEGSSTTHDFIISDRINLFWGGYGYENVAANTLGGKDDSFNTNILWQQLRDNDGNTKTTGITFSKEYNSSDNKWHGKVTVPYGIASGNALLSVSKTVGTKDVTLWSWHIWITDYDPSVDLKGKGYTVMDRNLGARDTVYHANSGNTNDDVLYYQFGRKDPFRATDDNTKTNAVATSDDAAGTDMAYAVNNPQTLIIKGSNNGWWTYNNKYNPTKPGFMIWQDPEATTTGKKSLFDPSPAGWKVPEASSYKFISGTYDVSNNRIRYSIQSSTTSDYYPVFFPFHGSLGNEGGINNGYSTEGNYWSSWQTEDDTSITEKDTKVPEKGRFFHVDSSGNKNNSNNRTRGCTIRCMVDASYWGQ